MIYQSSSLRIVKQLSLAASQARSLEGLRVLPACSVFVTNNFYFSEDAVFGYSPAVLISVNFAITFYGPNLDCL